MNRHEFFSIASIAIDLKSVGILAKGFDFEHKTQLPSTVLGHDLHSFKTQFIEDYRIFLIHKCFAHINNPK